MNQIKRAYVLLAITLVIILLTASAVLAAYGPKKAPSGSGSAGGSSSSDGGSSGGGGGGGSGCVTGYTLVNKACVKNEVSAVAGETPSETPTGAAAEQPAAPGVPEQPAEQELSEVKPALNLAWLLPLAVIALLAIAVVLYWYRKQSQSQYKPGQRKRD